MDDLGVPLFFGNTQIGNWGDFTLLIGDIHPIYYNWCFGPTLSHEEVKSNTPKIILQNHRNSVVIATIKLQYKFKQQKKQRLWEGFKKPTVIMIVRYMKKISTG